MPRKFKEPLKPTEQKCPSCRKIIAAGKMPLERHMRLAHGVQINPEDIQKLSKDTYKEIVNKSQKLLPLKFITRSPKLLESIGRCDICGIEVTRRWLYKNTSRGEIILCVSCRDVVPYSKKLDALDAPSRLPGSFGG